MKQLVIGYQELRRIYICFHYKIPGRVLSSRGLFFLFLPSLLAIDVKCPRGLLFMLYMIIENCQFSHSERFT